MKPGSMAPSNGPTVAQRAIIFDTTLRDGEQSPGASMTLDEKLQVAEMLDRLRVDVIEAGFPAASEGDFNAVHEIARRTQHATVCALARAAAHMEQPAFRTPSPRAHMGAPNGANLERIADPVTHLVANGLGVRQAARDHPFQGEYVTHIGTTGLIQMNEARKIIVCQAWL
jgi:hypothetical protein